MRVTRFFGGSREANTFLGPRDEPPLVAPLPLPTAKVPLTAGCPRVLEVFAAKPIVYGGFGEAMLVLASCLDIVASVDSLRC